MGKFNRDKRRGKPQMHKVICDECGKNCEVPFKPSGDKPIYCSDCFDKKGGGRRESDRQDFRGRDFKRQMYGVVCDSCGQNCEVPFKPTAGKPIYCDSCFGDKGGKRDHGKGRDRDRSGDREKTKKQLYIINEKLDKILKILSASKPKKEAEAKKEPKKVKTEKKIAKAEAEKKPKKVKKIVKKKSTSKRTVAKKTIAKKAVKKKSAKKKVKAKKKK